MDMGTRIKELRTEKSMTQTELGKVIGVEKSTISMYETNNSNPNDDMKKILAKFFEVSIDYLLGVTNIRNPYKEEPDSDLRRIERARRNMPQEEKERMMKVLEAAFDKYLPEK